jgi:hypothetical protein
MTEEICHNCGKGCDKSPVIWSVPHWFCSYECEREFYDKFEDVVDMEQNKIITRLKEKQEMEE